MLCGELAAKHDVGVLGVLDLWVGGWVGELGRPGVEGRERAVVKFVIEGMAQMGGWEKVGGRRWVGGRRGLGGRSTLMAAWVPLPTCWSSLWLLWMEVTCPSSTRPPTVLGKEDG